MNLSELLMDTQPHGAIAQGFYGVVVGIVTNNKDEEGLGRVKVKFPWLSGEDESHWARLAVTMAGDKRGIYFLPEVNDEVLVAFEHGDVRFPYIIGALWNGKDKPPINNDDGENNVRMIKSRSGHIIRLNDKQGEETIEIVDKTNKNSLVFNTKKNTITIAAALDINLSAPQGTIKLEAKNIEIKSSDNTKMESGKAMDITASQTTNIKGQAINLN